VADEVLDVLAQGGLDGVRRQDAELVQCRAKAPALPRAVGEGGEQLVFRDRAGEQQVLAEVLDRVVRQAGDHLAQVEVDALLPVAPAKDQGAGPALVLGPLQEVPRREGLDPTGKFHDVAAILLRLGARNDARRGPRAPRDPSRSRYACRMTRKTPLPLALAGLLALAAPSLRGESLPCQPCAGARLADPAAAADALAAIAKPAKLEPGSPLFVAWDVPLDGTADLELAGSIWAAGATPWLTLTFRTPAPLTGNLARLQGELEAAAKVAAAAPPKSFFQVVWRPESAPAAANPATPETPAAAETPAPFDPSQY